MYFGSDTWGTVHLSACWKSAVLHFWQAVLNGNRCSGDDCLRGALLLRCCANLGCWKLSFPHSLLLFLGHIWVCDQIFFLPLLRLNLKSNNESKIGMGQVTCYRSVVLELCISLPLLISVHTHTSRCFYFDGPVSVGKCWGSLKKCHRVEWTNIQSYLTWFTSLCYLHSVSGKL